VPLLKLYDAFDPTVVRANRIIDTESLSESAAAGIFDRMERGEEEIFPDPESQSIAEAWRTGAAKALERQFAAFVQAPAKNPV
jgi:hypothetical protein